MSTQQESSSAAGAMAEFDDFAALLQKEFKPKTDQAKSAVENAVHTLAQQALADTALVSTDVYNTIEGLNKLLEARQQLSNLVTYMDGKGGAEELIAKVMADPALLQSLTSAAKPE